MTIPTWIDRQDDVSLGDIRFLINHVAVNRGEADHYTLSDEPARTNGGGRPLLNGWCGTTNGIAVYACGLIRVERVARNGRIRISRVYRLSPAGQAALEEMGYPEI